MEIDSKGLTRQDVRRLVSVYFAPHSQRHALAGWAWESERDIETALATWVATVPAALWANSITGINPAMAAGLASHIDIETAPTVGSIWRFAGLDPTVVRRQGERCPWNPGLNTICRRIGHAFAVSPRTEGDFYGSLYRRRARLEAILNDNRREAERLPQAHVAARARRWTVKLFLAHYHHVAWTLATGAPPAKPYAISVLGHGNYIAPPNFGGDVR